MRVKNIVLMIVFILTNAITAYTVNRYTDIHVNKRLSKMIEGQAASTLILLDQNKTEEVKFFYTVWLYPSIVNASMKQDEHTDDSYRVKHIGDYRFLCESWEQNLSGIMLKNWPEILSKQSSGKDKLFLAGAKNLDDLCRKKVEPASGNPAELIQ